MRDQYDCIVIGGGPAGCTVAALVAEAGFSVLLVEREKMPRFHIGESLMPETYWPLQRLGVLEQMKASAHPKKYSVQFVSHTGKESQPFYFQEHDPRECSQTWQVLRSEFDQMLFDNAAAKGADCHDQTRVLEVLFQDAGQGTPGAARGVRLQPAGGTVRDVAARVVVDASGQQSLLATRLGIRRDNPELRKAAIWTYYRGAQRDEGIDAGATVILHTENKNSWFWYIPLAGDTTSVGVVGDRDYLLKNRGTPESVFAEELAKCEAVRRRVEQGEVVDVYRVAREFSYRSRQPAGDGWVLAGDAYGFIDPIYSSGVFLALKSGELVADCVVEGLRTGDLSGAQLGKWAEDFERGVQWIRKLVGAFYTNAFSFGQFMKQHPEHRGNLTDLLIGRVFHQGAGAIFDDMDPWVESVRQDIQTRACSREEG